MSRVLPILFNTDMVRAILDGRKTVTRRVIKPQPEKDMIHKLGYCVDGFHKLWNSTLKKSDLARYGWDANPWVWVIEFERREDIG